MLGSKEEPYPGRVLISFWCDYDNKNSSNFIFWVCLLALRNLSVELFFFFHFFNKIQNGKEATYPGHMLITFWCDSDITFLRGLHKKNW